MFPSHAAQVVHRSAGATHQSQTKTLTICIVDPKAGDYQGWELAATSAGVRFYQVATAEEALRFGRADAVDHWVVNAVLPGLSGFELCQMLKSRSSATPVHLVADEASPTVEKRAWAARATLFSYKPAHRIWFDAWLQQQQQRNATSQGQAAA